MKRKITILLMTLLLLCACLTSCKTTLDGKWKADTCSYNNNEMKIEQLFGTEFSMNLKEDGTAELVFNGEEKTGNWTSDSDSVTISITNNDNEIKMTLEDEKLVYEYDTDFYIYFEK